MELSEKNTNFKCLEHPLENMMTNVKKLNQVSENKMNTDMEMIFEQLHAIVFVCELDSYKVLFANRYAKEVYGEIKGKKCWEWINPELDVPCSNCLNKKMKAANGDIVVHDHFNHRNNKWYEVQEKVIRWIDGKLAKLSISYDISHRKDDEKELMALYRQQELFAKISEAFNKQETFANKVNSVLRLVGKFVNADRVSIYKNRLESNSIKLVYEWCKEGIEPKIDKLPPINYDSKNLVLQEIIDAKLLNVNDLKDKTYGGTLDLLKKFDVRAMLIIPIFLHDNHRGFISFEVCNKIRVWQKDEIQLINTFGNIITTSFERKRIEENRLRSEHNLREANITKDKFFQIITRDLLTPFSDISSLSSILMNSFDKWDDDKRMKFIKSIRESSQQGYKLLENLITWSKMQSGQMDFYKQEVDIRSVINLSLEQLKKQAEEKNITITGVPKEFVFVVADYLMLNTIFRNLLNNAIKFTPHNGEINIAMKKRTTFLEVKICDNGIGIEKQHLNSLFKIDLDNYSFGPLEKKGTGLGLIICREFIERNGGQIWVESKVGHGSCFTFTIPLPKKNEKE